MSKIIKIFLASAMIVVVAAAFSVAGRNASARDEDNKNNNGQGVMLGVGNLLKKVEDGGRGVIEGNVAGESLSVNFKGDFKANGVVVNSVSTSTNMLNVSLFGFSKDVSLAGAAFLGDITVNDIRAGDKIMLSGNFNQTTRVITISRVNDIFAKQRKDSAFNAAKIQQRIQELQDLIKRLQAQLGQ